MPTQKAPLRRTATRRSSRTMAARASEPEMSLSLDPMPEPDTATPTPVSDAPSHTRTHIIFSNKCRRCATLPGGINSLLSVLVVSIVALSLVTLSATVIIDSQSFQIQAFNAKDARVGVKF